MATLPPQTLCTRLTCASSKQRMADKDRLEFELSTLLSPPAGDITSTQQAAQRALSLSLPHSLTGECLPTVPQPQWESAGMTVYRTRGARQLPVPSSLIYPLLSRRNYTAHYTLHTTYYILHTAYCTLYTALHQRWRLTLPGRGGLRGAARPLVAVQRGDIVSYTSVPSIQPVVTFLQRTMFSPVFPAWARVRT